MPSIFNALASALVALSSVAIAEMAAALVSATKRIPSGPKASGPMDLNSALPCFMPAVRSAAWAFRNKPKTETTRRDVIAFIVANSCDPLWASRLQTEDGPTASERQVIMEDSVCHVGAFAET